VVEPEVILEVTMIYARDGLNDENVTAGEQCSWPHITSLQNINTVNEFTFVLSNYDLIIQSKGYNTNKTSYVSTSLTIRSRLTVGKEIKFNTAPAQNKSQFNLPKIA